MHLKLEFKETTEGCCCGDCLGLGLMELSDLEKKAEDDALIAKVAVSISRRQRISTSL